MMDFQARLVEVIQDLNVYTKQHPSADAMEYLVEQLAAAHQRFFFLAGQHDELAAKLTQRKTDAAVLEEAICDGNKEIITLRNSGNVEKITNRKLHKQIDELTDQLNAIEAIVTQ